MEKIRYAVVGLGHIAQTAMLPAFKHATKNSVLKAFVSSDPVKLDQLGQKYGVDLLYTDDQYETCLQSGEIDAVYIATPNSDHQRFVELALEHGIHVLCEKPLAPDSEACRSILRAAEKSTAKLMVAYRLHFDSANLRAVEIGQTGQLGDLRIFNSIFTMSVDDPDNIRLKKEKGGGPLHDIGIYCINAARYLFRAEPVEVMAMAASRNDDRFEEVEEMVSVIMKFPEERLATFTCSFGASDTARYDLIGTKGSLCLDSAYDYANEMEMTVTIDEKDKTKTFATHDQFAPELIYFSDCILNDVQPEPSVLEGLADIAIIEAIQSSLQTGLAVQFDGVAKRTRPSLAQEIKRPAVDRPPKAVHATPPSGND